MHATRLGKFAPLLLLATLTFLLTACPGVSGGGNSGAPQISSFTPSQNNVASGTPVTLNWVITGVPTSLSISGSDGTSLSSLIGTNTTVTPTTTTTYTLTATNSSGNDTETTTVNVGGTVTPPTDGSRTVSFGVSSTQDGTFTSDADGGITAGDPRIVNVSAGSTFYAQVTYSGPAPVTGVTIYLANSNPPGFKSDLAQGTNINGFTLQEAVGGCATDGTLTSITCTYPIDVASGTPNITGLAGAGSEFAYVLRTRIADTTGGDPYDQPPRGYVTVGGSSGGGTPPTNPPPTNPPPTNPPPTNPPPTNPPPTNPPPTNPPPTNPPSGNKAPTVDITNPKGSSISLDLAASGSVMQSFEAKGSDPDSGDTISYKWTVTPTTGAAITGDTTSTASVAFTAANTYAVKVTVTDSKKATASDTVSVKVNSLMSTPNQKPVAKLTATPDMFAFSASQRTVTLDASTSEDDKTASGDLDYTWEVLVNPSNTSINLAVDNDTNPATRQFSVATGVAGTYRVKVTVKDAEGLSSSATKDIVVAPPTLSLSATGLSDDALTLKPSANIQINATVESNASAVTWKLSSDSGDNGTITPGGSYTAPSSENKITLTATLKDFPSVTKAITINVSN